MWVVTGASGFVGGALVRALRDDGFSVTGAYREPVANGLHFTTWDPSELKQALANVDGIVHAAAVVHRPSTQTEEYRRFNVEGTRALISASRAVGIRRFVFISSIKVYGEAPASPIDERTAIAPELGYAASKADAERLVLAATDLQPVVLRLSPVYGIGDKGNVRTMIRAISRRRFLVPGTGSARKSIVHVSTVAEVVRALTRSAATGVFVVADSHTPSIRELADTIAQLLGRRSPISIPSFVLSGIAGIAGRIGSRLGVETKISADLIRKAQTSSICDPSRVIDELGLRCHVDLREALREEIDWLERDRLL